MKENIIAVGSDVSKDKIDVLIKNKKGLHFTIKNNELGFEKLLKKLPENSVVCMV